MFIGIKKLNVMFIGIKTKTSVLNQMVMERNSKTIKLMK